MIIRDIRSLCLEIALPSTCVLCGSPLSRPRPWPLCPECSCSLRPWSGGRCGRCGLPLISEIGLCMRCRGRERAFESAWPLFSYEGQVRDLVSEYKKRRRRSLAPFIAELFADAIGERWPNRTVVPVPPRPGKERVQGWDQVEEIARLLGKRGIPLARPLERRRSKEQKGLGRGARGLNARLAYTLRAGAVSPELPLLIDDVMTTCATLEACALALKGGGARTVEALVFAAD